MRPSRRNDGPIRERRDGRLRVLLADALLVVCLIVGAVLMVLYGGGSVGP